MKTKLSILTYSLANGGAEKVVSILVEKLKSNYDITLFLMHDTIFYDIPKDINLIYLENSNPFESGIFKILKLPFLAWKYKKLNKSEVSLSFMNRPNYINVFAKIFGMNSKVVISERAMPSLQHQSDIKGFLNKILIRWLYKKADIITANSYGNALDLKKYFFCDDVQVINNLIDLDKIKKLSEEECIFRDEKFTFITIGRLDSGKNHKLMIEAIKDLDAKLYIIGDGTLKLQLEKQIKRLNLSDKVILLGKQSNPYKYIAKADCFVFSSLHEGFPNVLLEALACGLPVISSDCKSGPREILSPNSDVNFQLKENIELAEYGILTPVQNIEKFQEAMKLLINDKALRENYQKKAKKRSNDFNVSKIIKEYEEVLCAV